MTRKLILSATVALIALDGCVKSSSTFDTVQICFEPVIGAEVRSASDNESFPKDESFCVTAITSSDNVFFENAEISFEQDAWTSSLLPYWPAGTELRFKGYAPADAQLKNFCPETNPEDLLVANPTKLFSSKDNPVHLEFTHALSKFSLRIGNGLPAGTQLRLQSITLDNIHFHGDFLPMEETIWNTTGPANEWVLYSLDVDTDPTVDGLEISKDFTYIMENVRVIPQDIKSTLTIVCAVKYPGYEWGTNQVWKSEKPLEIDWQAGRKYTYSISILEEGMTYTSGISSWNN